MPKSILSRELNTGRSEIFSYLYPKINNYLIEEGTLFPSRVGDTKEVLNFKTIVDNPNKRCVGGYGRNINIFFLLTEALWIYTGRKDVAFLSIFNEKMKDYSDDKETFHAPYGYRLRHWGLASNENETNPFLKQQDQLEKAILALKENPADRRIVLSIWNPDLDLATQSSDHPCNSMLMFKIRENKLYTTIQNRSNDLHLGLPTNVFQFSFIGEVIANILGVGLGQQVHNSQSLHFYLSNPIAQNMYVDFGDLLNLNLYDVSHSVEMNFNFTHEDTKKRILEVDTFFNRIIFNLENLHAGLTNNIHVKEEISSFSPYFAYVLELLEIYADYKKSPKTDADKMNAVHQITSLQGEHKEFINSDYETLAINFFVSRIKSETLKQGLMESFSSRQIGTL